MDSTNQSQRVLLVWSAEDIELQDREDTLLVPVSVAGYVATQRATKGRMVEVENWIENFHSPSIWNMVEIQQAEASIMAFQQPWLTCFPRLERHTRIMQILEWHRLLAAIVAKLAPQPVLLIPPRAFIPPGLHRPTSWDHPNMIAFWACAKTLERKGRLTIWRSGPAGRGRYQNETLRYFRRAVRAGVGGLISWATPLLLRRPTTPTQSRLLPTKILLAGVQATDGIHQAPLAERLFHSYGATFRWISIVRDSHGDGMTTEEISLLQSAPQRAKYWDNPEDVKMPNWIHPALAMWTDLYDMWRIAGVLQRGFSTALSRADWFDWLGTTNYRDLRKQYERWRKYLDEVAPHLIAGHSTIQDMAYIRAWARKNAVPFVLFPHGIFPEIWAHYHVDGDYLGVFGSLMAQQVEQAGIATARKVVACGGMQFESKHAPLSSKSATMAELPSDRVLYLGQFSHAFSPSSPGSIYREIETLFDACRGTGCQLVIREHPRVGKGTYQQVADLLTRNAMGRIAISSEPSVAIDFAKARLVVTSHFDGALVDALYCDKPVIVYQQTREHRKAPGVWGQFGGPVGTTEELVQAIHSAGKDNQWLQNKLRQQRSFLAAYMGSSSDGTTWQKAEELITLALTETERRKI